MVAVVTAPDAVLFIRIGAAAFGAYRAFAINCRPSQKP
jgi:hypothetical protein